MNDGDKRLLDGIGLWFENLTSGSWRGLPGLFLDRDGVLLEEVGFLARPADVRMIDGATNIVGWANRMGIPVIVVTNQSGIGRRFFDWRDFSAVQNELYRQLILEGAHIDIIAACAYHSEATPPYSITDHPWRKPNAGMLQVVAREFGLSLSHSALIGDKWSDLEAAAKAGLAHGILVKTGYGCMQANTAPNFEAGSMRICIAPNLEYARDMLDQRSWPEVPIGGSNRQK